MRYILQKNLLALFVFFLLCCFSLLASAANQPFPLRAALVAKNKKSSDHFLSTIQLSPDNKEIYALDESARTVSIINITNGSILKTIQLPIEDKFFGTVFFNLIFSLDGSKAYVTDAAKNIYIIDTVKKEITGKVTNKRAMVRGSYYGTTGVGLSSDGRYLYATDSTGYMTSKNWKEPNTEPLFHIIDTRTDSVINAIKKPFFDWDKNFIFGWQDAKFTSTKDGHLIYFTDSLYGNISTFNADTNTLTDNVFTIEGYPSNSTHRFITDIFINTTNDKLYILSYEGDIYTIDLAAPKPKIKLIIGLDADPVFGSALDNNKKIMYVGVDNNVAVIDLNVGKVTAKIPVGEYPISLSLSSNGSTLYVGNANSNNISVIDTQTNKVVRTIELVFQQNVLPYKKRTLNG